MRADEPPKRPRAKRRPATKAVLAGAALLALLTAGAAGAQDRATAPDPGGDERADLTAPPPGKELGFNDSFELEGLGSSLQALLVRGAGGNAARMPLQWWDLEPERGRFDEALWARYERAYRELLALDVRPHFSITHAPPWARDPEYRGCQTRALCNFPPARDELGAWRSFLSELARRFPAAGFGIWNEPNYLGSWRSGVDPERYAELAAAAYDAVKSVSAEADVLGPALGTAPRDDGLGYREFLERAYAAEPSLRDNVDAIDIHIYPGFDLGAGSFFAQVIDDVRVVRAAYGDAGRPIYVSEVGASTTGPFAVGEFQQGLLVLAAIRKLLTMPDVTGVLIHRLVESTAHPPDDIETGLGLMRYSPPGPPEPKFAYCTLTRAVAVLYPLCLFRFFVLDPPEDPYGLRPGR